MAFDDILRRDMQVDADDACALSLLLPGGSWQSRLFVAAMLAGMLLVNAVKASRR
ncbi:MULTISPECIES: hypothetical protein [Pseudomonas]|uniref:hypothetical protein n=1 Tax=Pseudomonas TaxID=286 RepID=UPI001E38BB74|nr:MULTISPECIES: hypothetical protein [Pseudomonas]MCE1117769.1 hypothetical protein [Pseudomonas sp. NMI795_08]